MQEEIARSISENLRPRLTGEEQRRVAKRHTESEEAYRLYLKGRHYWNKRTEDSLRQATQYFERAIDKDPLYALAYSGLADTYYLRSGQGLPPKEALPKAKAAARRAVEIDDQIAEAHTSLASISFWYEWDWAEAEREFQRAIELNPGYATAQHWYAEYLAAMGRPEASIAAIERAQELDPLSLSINRDVGVFLYLARRHDQAIAQFRRTLELDAQFSEVHRFLGLAYEQKGMYQEAIAEFEQDLASAGRRPSALAALGHAYARAGREPEARRLLDELKALAAREYVSPYHVAVVYAGLGENLFALDWLERAYAERADDTLCYLKVEPRFDRLRQVPRFADLLRRLGLAP